MSSISRCPLALSHGRVLITGPTYLGLGADLHVQQECSPFGGNACRHAGQDTHMDVLVPLLLSTGMGTSPAP